MIDQKYILFFLLLAALLVFTNCECGDDENENTPVPQEVWEDSVSGLMWQKGLSPFLNWNGLINYCEKLNWKGYTDWRMPSISELRSLVRGCSNLETGGKCGVTDDCLDADCDNGYCGCEEFEGPGIDGAYLPASLGFDIWGHSASVVTNSIYSNHVWNLDFKHYGLLWAVAAAGDHFREGQDDENHASPHRTSCVRDAGRVNDSFQNRCFQNRCHPNIYSF